MKIFWSIIALLLIAATVALTWPEDESLPGFALASQSSDSSSTAPVPATPAGRAAADDDSSEPEPQPESPTEPPSEEADEDVATFAPDASAPEPAGDDALTDVQSDTDAEPEAADATQPDTVATSEPAGEPASPAEEAAAPEDAAAALLSATVVEQPDGSLRIADKYTVRGTGSASDPYVVPWDLLVSLSSTYRPRDGLDQLPEFIMRLHDKHVKITGYVAFPAVSGQIDELLVMLNQWDGCCLGVPPSVYDSVEVRLVDPIPATDATVSVPYGSVTGRMTVDPYFVNDWLVGLYLMEDAEIQFDS